MSKRTMNMVLGLILGTLAFAVFYAMTHGH